MRRKMTPPTIQVAGFPTANVKKEKAAFNF